ncbi:putative 3-beta hydroxysteroid dehydrogenase/isomerase, NAD(P)-binding domain superfamily [Helianthus anomalus]
MTRMSTLHPFTLSYPKVVKFELFAKKMCYFDHYQAQLVDPAVKGTLNVLKSATKVQSLKKVVLTSSMATVVSGKRLLESGVMVDETWFTDPLVCEQKKTLAEDTAFKFAKEKGLELVVINPGYVTGPFLQLTLNLTTEGIMGLMKTGKEVFSDGIYRLVDVRDVATAHILAFENPKTNGRCWPELDLDL